MKFTKGDNNHAEHLSSRAKKYSKQHALPWWSKHVTMNQFPAKVFLNIFTTIHLIVPCNILMQGSEQNHSHHSREEEDNDEGVQNTEPLNVCMWHGFQNVVPA